MKNNVESEKHVKLRFFTVLTDPKQEFSSNMGFDVSEQCCMQQLFYGSNLNSRISPILFVICSNKPHMDVFLKVLY